jgi:hypothetical protein
VAPPPVLALDWAVGVAGTLSTRYPASPPRITGPGQRRPSTHLRDPNNSRVLGDDLARHHYSSTASSGRTKRALFCCFDRARTCRKRPQALFVLSALALSTSYLYGREDLAPLPTSNPHVRLCEGKMLPRPAYAQTSLSQCRSSCRLALQQLVSPLWQPLQTPAAPRSAY